MRKNKLKIAKIRCLLPLLVLIISAGILSFVANYVNMASYKQVRTKAKLNAVTYSDRMVEELNRGINITNSLKNILLNDNGNIKQFEDNIKGIVVGEFLSIEETQYFDNIFFDIAKKYNIPIASGFKISHGKQKMTLPYGVQCQFDTKKGEIKMLESIFSN